jgi:hypothetical protein
VSEEKLAKEAQHLERVNAQLSRYEHPLFDWEAHNSPSGVEVTIRLKFEGVYNDVYRLSLKPREIEARGFEWDFQRQLYNCLHDYLVEMFSRSPHIAEV